MDCYYLLRVRLGNAFSGDSHYCQFIALDIHDINLQTEHDDLFIQFIDSF